MWPFNREGSGEAPLAQLLRLVTCPGTCPDLTIIRPLLKGLGHFVSLEPVSFSETQETMPKQLLNDCQATRIGVLDPASIKSKGLEEKGAWDQVQI